MRLFFDAQGSASKSDRMEEGKAAIQLGLIADEHSISFDCLLPGSIEVVWEYLTQSAPLATWLAKGQVEPQVNGAVRLHFEVGEAPVRSSAGAVIRGVVSRHEPPYMLTYSWIDTSRDPQQNHSLFFGSVVTVVNFELEPQGRQVMLKLRHRRLPTELLSKYAAGWHTHLGLLIARMRREDPEPLLPAFNRLLPRYEQQAAMLRAGILSG
jgi:uncharacterized protein YndB with AHSA1/START domain